MSRSVDMLSTAYLPEACRRAENVIKTDRFFLSASAAQGERDIKRYCERQTEGDTKIEGQQGRGRHKDIAGMHETMIHLETSMQPALHNINIRRDSKTQCPR